MGNGLDILDSASYVEGDEETLKMLMMFLLVLSLMGCGSDDRGIPVYEMVEEPDYNCLYMDDVTYRQKTSWEERSGNNLISYGEKYCWVVTEGIGEAIGTYEQRSTTYIFYFITGDENNDFFYSRIQDFHFGPSGVNFWLKDGVELGEPDTETVSEIIIENMDGEELGRIKDTDRIKELLDTYENGEKISDTKKVEDWNVYTLALCHADYPFLRYEMEGLYSPSHKLAACQNDYSLGHESMKLPEEWGKIFQNIKTDE